MFKSLVLSLVVVSSALAAASGNDSIATVMPGKAGKIAIVQKSDGYKFKGRMRVADKEPTVLQVNLSQEYINSRIMEKTSSSSSSIDTRKWVPALGGAVVRGGVTYRANEPSKSSEAVICSMCNGDGLGRIAGMGALRKTGTCPSCMGAGVVSANRDAAARSITSQGPSGASSRIIRFKD